MLIIIISWKANRSNSLMMKQKKIFLANHCHLRPSTAHFCGKSVTLFTEIIWNSYVFLKNSSPPTHAETGTRQFAVLQITYSSMFWNEFVAIKLQWSHLISIKLVCFNSSKWKKFAHSLLKVEWENNGGNKEKNNNFFKLNTLSDINLRVISTSKWRKENSLRKNWLAMEKLLCVWCGELKWDTLRKNWMKSTKILKKVLNFIGDIDLEGSWLLIYFRWVCDFVRLHNYVFYVTAPCFMWYI